MKVLSLLSVILCFSKVTLGSQPVIIYSRNVFEEGKEEANSDDNLAVMDGAADDTDETEMNSVEQESRGGVPRWTWFPPQPTGAPSSNRKKSKLLCEGERGTLQCNDLQVIKIRDVIYGRRRNRPGLCNGSNSYRRCRAKSAPQIVRRLCDGRKSCDLFASSSVFGDPCKGINKYLHVTYKCKERIPGPIADCASVALTHKTDNPCQIKRAAENNKRKAIFKLKSQKTSFPTLDLSTNQTIGVQFRNPLSRHWMQLYIDTIKFNRRLAGFWILNHKDEFSSLGQYEAMFKWIIASQRLANRTSEEDKKYFRFHFQQLPFKDLNNFCLWKEDRVFAEQRLAGLNPMSLERVSLRRGVGVEWYELSSKLNAHFDWAYYIEHALDNRMTLNRAIRSGRVFALRYPSYEGLFGDKPASAPYLKDPHATITLFVTQSQYMKPRQLTPIAIQLDPGPTSKVYTPEDGELWLMAKALVQIADYTHAEVVEHLVKTHLAMGPVCVCLHRHLHSLHPLHQMLKFHCRALFGTNSVGYEILEEPVIGTFDKLLTVGRSGALKMIERSFKKFTWKDTDFFRNLKKRGVYDARKLPYYPYRDDGKLIYNAIKNMATEYVELYYHSDKDVAADFELQDFANEVSAEGTLKPHGGKGEIKGFPAKITSKRLLVDTLNRIIWTLTAQHAAVNYPVTYYGAQSPIMSTRLFNGPMAPPGQFNIYSLPGKNISAIQAGLAMVLGSMLYDTLFDYASRPEEFLDKKARTLVFKHYNELNYVTREQITARNEKRYRQGHLTYPYLVPGWIPNSIHS